MAESSTILTLQQMCDLALNTPDVGVINFNVLRALVHVMIKQLGLLETKVEYRGTDSEKIQGFLSSAKPGTLTLTEYSISPDKKDQTTSTSEGQVILIQNDTAETQFTVTMTKDYFDNLEQTVTSMQNQIKELQELPGNFKLFESMKEGNNTPVLDMFQILSIQKRMDAVEQGMEKVASLMESIAKGGAIPADLGATEGGEATDSNIIKQIIHRIEKLEGGKTDGGSSKAAKVEPEAPKKDTIDSESFQNLKADVALIKDCLSTLNQGAGILPEGDEKTEEPLNVRVNNLELKHTDFEEQINSLDTGFSRLTTSLQERVEGLEKEIGEVLEKVHLMPEGAAEFGGGGDQSSLIAEMRTQLMALQEETENVVDVVKKITDERAGKEHTMDILVEQIELLKTVKADREDLEDALADKADACQINRKVSYEQFDQACGDMAKSLEEALGKLTQQEQLWTQALTNIQSEVGSKMDKNELNPLRDFINSKLKSLQEKFKALTAMKKEQEAAGTKTRFLRNVNCISCDKDVVMRKNMDPTLNPQPYALPPTKSMGPYLAYELDQLRKQQKPTNKNMNVFENAILTSRSGKSPDHLCNRYCGGSHTVTTPHQRVTRLGHFLEQWGPEIGPVNDTHIRGTDGKMYKARDDEELKKLAANDKAPSTHGEAPPVVFVPAGDAPQTKSNTTNMAVHSEATPTTVSHQDMGKTPATVPSVKSAANQPSKSNQMK